MDSLVRILKPKGVITAQVGSQDKKPQQVENWLNVFNQNFGNTKLSRVYIPSFDCSWNFSSSINHWFFFLIIKIYEIISKIFGGKKWKN